MFWFGQATELCHGLITFPPKSDLEHLAEGAHFILTSSRFETDRDFRLIIGDKFRGQPLHLVFAKPIEQWSLTNLFAVNKYFVEWDSPDVAGDFLKSVLQHTQGSEWREKVWHYREECGHTLIHTLAFACAFCNELA